MRRACIDIGSNTTRLLVADDAVRGLTVVGEERAYTRIAAALADGDTIPRAKCAEVVEVVARQLERAHSLGAEEVHGVATAAIRRAVNGPALLAELRAGPGLEVRILTAAEEARLAFRGAAGMHEGPAPAPLGVLDVGGGSSEVVIGRPGDPVHQGGDGHSGGDGRPGGEIVWWTSLPFGSGSLAAAHLHHDPPTAGELDAARAEIERACAAVRFDGPVPAGTLAVGGSATSLCRLAGPRLDAAAFARALALLGAEPAALIAARHEIDPVRARLLPAGLVVLQALAQRLGGVIECGRGGIREGVLLEALAR